MAEISPRELRDVFGHFVTGVTVVTAMTENGPIGFAVNSFTSVSLEPPLVSFYADVNSSTWRAMSDRATFAINILANSQAELTAKFARKGVDRFEGVRWTPGPATGDPLVDDIHGWIECRRYQTLEIGDHILVVGEVLAVSDSSTRSPLAFHRGKFVPMPETK